MALEKAAALCLAAGQIAPAIVRRITLGQGHPQGFPAMAVVGSLSSVWVELTVQSFYQSTNLKGVIPNSCRFVVWLGSTVDGRFGGGAAFGQVQSRKPVALSKYARAQPLKKKDGNLKTYPSCVLGCRS